MATDFEPIGHKNKQALVDSLVQARLDIKDHDKYKKVNAVLSFTNNVEYIVRDLVRNLRRFVKAATHREFNGVFYYPFGPESKDLERATLGTLIGCLKQFNFPDRDSLIENLDKFNNSRIKLIHKSPDEPLDESLLLKIPDNFENIFSRYRSIQDEMLSRWPR